MRRGIFFAAMLAFVLASAQAGFATEVISSFAGGSGTFQGGIVAGNSFTASSGFTFNSLGVLDSGSDGIHASFQVGLFDTATQTLLASATVTPASPLINGYRYAGIPATTIAAGNSFTIAAVLPTTNVDAWSFGSTLSLGPGFTGAGTGKFFGSNAALVYPSQNDGVTYNIVNASDQVVPEPATLALVGVVPMLLLRQRRAARR